MLARLVLGTITAGAIITPALAGMMTAEEAREYGIVDQVFTKENRSIAPNSPVL